MWLAHRVRRVRSGLLHRRHEAVYTVGHTAMPPLGRAAAAVLAGGEGALLGHRWALTLLDVLPPPPTDPDITLPRRTSRAEDGIRFHSTRLEVVEADITVIERIPLTTATRALFDIAGASRTATSPGPMRRR